MYLYLYRHNKCNCSVAVHLAVLMQFLFERTGHLFKLIYMFFTPQLGPPLVHTYIPHSLIGTYKLKFFSAVSIKIKVSWDVTACSLVDRYQCFGGT